MHTNAMHTHTNAMHTHTNTMHMHTNAMHMHTHTGGCTSVIHTYVMLLTDIALYFIENV